MRKKAINKLKTVLTEQGKTKKWLAEKRNKNETARSCWWANEVQPSMDTFIEISKLLNVDMREWIILNKN